MVKYHEKDYGNTIVNNFRNYLYERGSAENTIDDYCRTAKMFVNYIGISNEEEVSKITKLDIRHFVDYLKEFEYEFGKKYIVETINNKIAGMNQFLECYRLSNLKVKAFYCQRKTFIDDDKMLDNSEINRMINESKKVNILLYFVLRILTQMGLRVSEIKFITVESLNRKYINIYNKGSLRKVPLPTDLRMELTKYCEEKGLKKGPIISIRNDNPLNRSTIGRNIKKLAKELEISLNKAHPHSFRHSFAVNYLKRYGSESISRLADILGHRSIETTRIYLRDTLTNAANSLAANSLKIKIAS